MTVKGIVKNGVVVLEEGVTVSEGTEVKVEFAQPARVSDNGSVRDLLFRFAGKAKGKYPTDFARNHDHYIHGTPKRQGSE